MSHFTRKSLAKATKAVDSYNCLSTTKAARSDGDWEYETVLFVPYTPDGALATALRAYEKKRGAKKRIRIVERAGVSLKSKLFSSNPWSKEGCVRTGCFPCLPGGGEGGACRRENVTYCLQCNSCLKQGEGVQKSKFIGGNQVGHFIKGVRSIGLLMLASLRLLFSINMSQNTIRMCRLSGE